MLRGLLHGLLHELLPLASRQKPTPRATDRAVAGGGEGGEGSEGGEGGEEGQGGGGASWLMVTVVFVQAELHHARHVARPCGGEDESLEMWYAQGSQVPSPSRLLAAVVLGALLSRSQPVTPLLPPQSGSQ